VKGDDELLDRIIRFRRLVQDRSATRTLPVLGGTALVNDDYPRSYSHNFIRLDNPVSPDDLVAESHRVQAAAGHRHRRIDVHDERLGRALEPSLTEMGWSANRILAMVHRRAPEKPPITDRVEEIDFDRFRPWLAANWAGDYADSPDTVRQLVERELVTQAAVRARYLAVWEDDEVASFAHLYSDGEVAEIDNVGTFDRWRGRGHASAVVMRAVEVANDEGHLLVFLFADDSDWPKDLYRRLGFDPIGAIYEFSPTGQL
jgi:GNAT superfamily N-acetyltransferase